MIGEVSGNLFDRALLLGAVFGDGYIQKRGEDSYKVVVTSGNQYPVWFDRIDRLFESVFGRSPRCYDKKTSGDEVAAAGQVRLVGYRFCEKYLTVDGSTLVDRFGITDKYAEGHRRGSEDPAFVPVPAWVASDAEASRAFLLGLVETDGWFLHKTDARCRSGKRWACFGLAQKDTGLASWAEAFLIASGFVVTRKWFRQAGTWQVRAHDQMHVKRLGEWLGSSAKYAALLASGEGPRTQPISRKTGEPLKLKPARFFPALDMAWQLAWRELRATGMSLDKIAKAYGVSKGTVHVVTSDVVPASRMPPDEADRRLQAYFETHGKPAPRVWDLQKAKASKSPRSAA